MYTDKLSNAFIPVGTGPLGVEDLSATAAVHGEYLCVRPCSVNRIMFNISTLTVSTSTPSQVRFSKRPLQGSDTGAVVLGSLIIPDATAVGKVVYKDIAKVSFAVGDTLKLENSVVGTGGSVAGQGYYCFEAFDDPETVANNSDMVASA